MRADTKLFAASQHHVRQITSGASDDFCRGVREGKEGLLFCKKEAKNFFELGHGRRNRHWPKRAKFFCFFFVHKKEDSSLSISGPLPSDGPMQTVIDHTDRYYQPAVPGAPLNGPIRLAVIQPP
jgi:hypothetical protein